jgi:hypothetical protein
MATSKMGIKHKPLSISEEINATNKEDGIPNVPQEKTAAEHRIPVRMVTDKVLGWSHTGENVLKSTAN